MYLFDFHLLTGTWNEMLQAWSSPVFLRGRCLLNDACIPGECSSRVMKKINLERQCWKKSQTKNISSTELESGNACLGAFLQTPAPVLDKNSGPMGARFLSSTGLECGTPHWETAILPSTSIGQKSVSRKSQAFNTEWDFQSRIALSFRAPPWPQKNRLRIEHFNREWAFQLRIKLPSENVNFVRRGMNFFCFLVFERELFLFDLWALWGKLSFMSAQRSEDR